MKKQYFNSLCRDSLALVFIILTFVMMACCQDPISQANRDGRRVLEQAAPFDNLTGIDASGKPFTVGPGGANVPGMSVFGDSISCGTGASVFSNGYAFILRPKVGGAFFDDCRSGDQEADQNYERVFTSTAPVGSGADPVFISATGTNDVTVYNSTVNKQYIFRRLKLGSLAWLALPSANKTLGSAATTSGTWAADNSLQNGVAVASTTNGSTLTFTVATTQANQAAYLWYLIADTNGGTFSVKLDGALQNDAYNGTTTIYGAGDAGATIATQNGINAGVAGLRVPIAVAGTHTLLVTVTSATSASNNVSIYGVGVTPAAVSPLNPYVIAVSPNHQNNANDALAGTYAGWVSGMATTLAGDNLNVVYADTRSALGTNYATYYADTIHPNDAGHGLMAGTILAAMPTAKVTGNLVPNSSSPVATYDADAINPSRYWRPNPFPDYTHGWGRGVLWDNSFGQATFTANLQATGLTVGFPNVGSPTKYCIYSYFVANGGGIASNQPPGKLPTFSDCIVRISGNGVFYVNSVLKVDNAGASIGTGKRILNSDSLVQALGTVTTTATASDNMTAFYMQPSSVCSAAPQNAAAAAMTGVYAIWTATNTITVYHPSTAGAIFVLFCSGSGQY